MDGDSRPTKLVDEEEDTEDEYLKSEEAAAGSVEEAA